MKKLVQAKIHYVLLTAFMLFSFSLMQAKLQFSNRTSHLVTNNQDFPGSTVMLGKVASVIGWGHDSIIRSEGCEPASEWTEQYTDGAVINSPCSLLICNSNAINALSDFTIQNSNAIVAKCQDIKNNSNALLYCCNNNSNAILSIEPSSSELARLNSNALLYCCNNNSNAILSLDLEPGSSELARLNSNALLYCCNNNSNAIQLLSDCNIVNKANIAQNAVDIASNVIDIRHNSNALLYCCNNNSNAIQLLSDCSIVNKANIAQNVVDIANNVIDIRHNSNALLYCCNNNSNAIISLDNRVTINEADIAQNAVDIANNVIDIRHNSNALLYCCNNNSNAIISLDNRVTINEADIAQNALDIANNVIDIRHNSNALLYCCNNNSNAIIKLRADLSTVDALVPDIDICTSTFDLMFDLWISQDNILTVQTKAGPDVCIDGRGHYIHFSRDVSDIFVIESGLCVTTKNVVLKDFSDKILDIHPSSRLKFGEGTVVELADCETLLRDWEFEGSSTLSGFGNEINLDDHAILVNQGSQPTFHDVCFVGVKDNNIRSVGNNISITLKDVQLCLTGDYSYTSGALRFKKEVIVTGLHEFSYETDVTSTICSKATLLIDKNTSFNYSPIDLRDRHIEMQDESARMFWFGCDIKISNTWRLKTGTLCVDHKVPVLRVADGDPKVFLIFGDGNSANDLSLTVFPSAILDMQPDTQLIYENVDI